jgi:hypothetical protein
VPPNRFHLNPKDGITKFFSVDEIFHLTLACGSDITHQTIFPEEEGTPFLFDEKGDPFSEKGVLRSKFSSLVILRLKEAYHGGTTPEE